MYIRSSWQGLRLCLNLVGFCPVHSPLTACAIGARLQFQPPYALALGSQSARLLQALRLVGSRDFPDLRSGRDSRLRALGRSRLVRRLLRFPRLLSSLFFVLTGPHTSTAASSARDRIHRYAHPGPLVLRFPVVPLVTQALLSQNPICQLPKPALHADLLHTTTRAQEAHSLRRSGSVSS